MITWNDTKPNSWILRAVEFEIFCWYIRLEFIFTAFVNQGISPSYPINVTDTPLPTDIEYTQNPSRLTNQVQVATQTQLPMSLTNSVSSSERKSSTNSPSNMKGKKNKYSLGHHVSNQQFPVSRSQQILPSSLSQNYQIDPSAGLYLYSIT